MAHVAKAPENDGFVRILAPIGFHASVCVDVVDRGLKETKYGPKERVSIHFLIDTMMPTGQWNHPHTGEVVDVHEDLAGKPFMVQKTFNNTLGEGSTLRDFLKKWRGKDFTPDQLRGFDLDAVIGAPAALVVTHNENDGTWYANIDGASQLPKDWTHLTVPTDYVRIEEREPRAQSQPAEAPATVGSGSQPQTGPPPNFPDPDDDLPF